MRIALLDDHPVARRGLEQALTDLPDGIVALSTGSADELTGVLSAGDSEVDVVVLDLYLGGEQPSLELVRQVAAAHNVLVMSASGRPADVVGAVRAGAHGYLTKQCSLDVIVAAVTTVAAGGFALSPKLADILHAELARPNPTADLSPREQQTLEYISCGLTHAQAAARMGVKESTVDTYVERIRAKLQVGNKAELTAAWQRRGSGPP
ncbi:response regulator transcription factor [Amycolatopsis sp. NPDC004625]|uniref:response regulator transcription factor n=1 Tax=Amycolatopsis sp. NPDC004625 TaxID=3154670 RepID=UPI0033BD2F0E